MDCHCFSPALEVCSGPSFALASIDVVITVMMVLVLGEKLFSYYVHPSTVLTFSDRVRGASASWSSQWDKQYQEHKA